VSFASAGVWDPFLRYPLLLIRFGHSCSLDDLWLDDDILLGTEAFGGHRM
jgi:hypothetical protein